MIFVTGATGLVGTHLLIQLVRKNTPIRALYRSEKKKKQAKEVFTACCEPEDQDKFENIDWFQGDILDITSLEKAFHSVTHVYHCAGLISFNPSDYKKLRKVNIEGTANIVNQCIVNKIEKLCHVSSIAVFGSYHRNPVSEEAVWDPEQKHSVYAITKYGAEMEVWRGTQEGVDAVIVNPGVIIGRGFFESGSGYLFHLVDNGLSFYAPGSTGYVAVEDVVTSMQLLMDSNRKNDRYIVVAENLSFKQVFTWISEALHRGKPKRKLSKTLLRIVYYVQWIGSLFGFKRSVFRSSIRSAFSHRIFDHQKVKKELHISFNPVKEAIDTTALFFQRKNADR